MGRPGFRISTEHAQAFALAVCSNTPIQTIMREFGVSNTTISKYLAYINAKLNNKIIGPQRVRILNKLIVSHIDTLLAQNKYTRQNIKTRIASKDFYTFAMDICNDEADKDIAALYGVAIGTVLSYKFYAKAVISGNKDLGLKIYKTLNKAIVKYINDIVENNKYTKKLTYKSKDKLGPEQIGPNQEKYVSGVANMKPLPILEIVPKLDLNSCAINTLTPVEQPKPEKEDVPVSEIIRLLQSALNSIQDLIQKL